MIFQNRFPVSLLYVYLLMIVSFTERFVQQQAPSSFSMISINLLSGNNHGWCHSIHLNVSYFALRRRDRPYSMITHYMDMYLNRCRRPSIWAWTCMNNYRGTSILTWQPRRLTGPEHSLQGTFTHVLRRSRLHVTPLLYAQWWSMPPLLGLPTGPTLCRIAINWNRSSDVLLSLHATGTRKQPAWQQWWTIWSGSHWTPGVITNGWSCFIVCNIILYLLLQLITLFRFSGRTAEDQVMMKCIKFLTLGPVCTSTPFQQLYACGTLPSSLIHSHSLQSFKTTVSVYNWHWLTWP